VRLIFIVIAIGAVLLAMAGWRFLDHLADRAEMSRLRQLQPEKPPVFDHSMVAALPEPARRFFTFAISEGTPLRRVANISMTGQFSLGDANDPKYMTMAAYQVLAAPDGFVWGMRAQSGHLRLSGSDSGAWTRFWMGGLLPVARVGGVIRIMRAPRSGAVWPKRSSGRLRPSCDHQVWFGKLLATMQLA